MTNDIPTILELAKTNNVDVDIKFSNSGESITVYITGGGVTHVEQFDRSEFVLPLAHHVAQAIDNFNEVPKGDILKTLEDLKKPIYMGFNLYDSETIPKVRYDSRCGTKKNEEK